VSVTMCSIILYVCKYGVFVSVGSCGFVWCSVACLYGEPTVCVCVCVCVCLTYVSVVQKLFEPQHPI
jgi:hypothetical protein